MPTDSIFPPNTKVYIIGNDTHEAAYWQEDGKAYGRLRLKGFQSWENTLPFDVPLDELDILREYFDQQRQARNRMLDHCPRFIDSQGYLTNGRRKRGGVTLWDSLTGYATRLVKSLKPSG